MQVRKLTIQQIRNFIAQTWEFGPITVIAGQNGAGKTTILEALALLSTAESFRAGKIEEVIRLGADLGRITGEIESDGELENLELLLTRGLVQDKKTQSRLYSVNGVRRRKIDFKGKLATVVFRPEDMRLIEGSPSRRRSFMDIALSGLDFNYHYALINYEKVLKTRNRLLQHIRDGRQPQTTLMYWDQALVKHGEVLQIKRRDFLAFLRQIGFALDLGVTYEPSLINSDRLAGYQGKEIAAGHTLIGPHKDDFVVTFPASHLGVIGEAGLEHLPILAYGSRGQQRLAVLWLKLGELQFAEKKLAQPPVLLLDDLLSELDDQSRQVVFEWLPKYQSILTTADLDILPEIHRLAPGIVEFRV